MSITKRELRELTNHKISDLAIRCVDDSWEIVGKFCRCSYLGDNNWDVWICNPDNLTAGLSQRKLRAIARKVPPGTTFRELTGEGLYDCMPTEALLLNMRVLGIRKRRVVSEQQKAILANWRKSVAA